MPRITWYVRVDGANVGDVQADSERMALGLAQTRFLKQWWHGRLTVSPIRRDERDLERRPWFVVRPRRDPRNL